MNKNFMMSFLMSKQVLKDTVPTAKSNKLAMSASLSGNPMYSMISAQSLKNEEKELNKATEERDKATEENNLYKIANSFLSFDSDKAKSFLQNDEKVIRRVISILNLEQNQFLLAQESEDNTGQKRSAVLTALNVAIASEQK